MAKELSRAKCILLAVHYASSANIKALYSFTPTHAHALDPELILRILLTYLPESVEPKEYTQYVEEVASRLYLDHERQEVDVDLSPIKDLSEEQAEKKVTKLHLRECEAASFPSNPPRDVLTRFLIARACLMDDQAGLLNLVPQLMEPFIPHNDYLRKWYISVALPVIRLELEFYSDESASKVPQVTLAELAEWEVARGVDILLRKGVEADGTVPMTDHSVTSIGRDTKSLVGPWMYGHTERKRRKLNLDPQESSESVEEPASHNGARKVPMDGISETAKTGHAWEYMFEWIVRTSQEDLTVVAHLIEDWDGPSDVDFGGYSEGGRDYLDEDILRKLELQYAQSAFAACYSAQHGSEEHIRGAHGILARLAELLDFVPPPDLASSVDSLPRVDKLMTKLETAQNVADLAPDRLLGPEHPLTTPRLQTYMLLQMMVYSTYQLSGLGHETALVNVAKMKLYASADEQLALLQKVLHGLADHNSRKDEAEWNAQRKKLMWLWNWGIDDEDQDAHTGAGVLGKVKRETFEEEMLKVFVDTSCYGMATKLYLDDQSSFKLLPIEHIERVVLAKAMEAYDGASNGNKSRGGMKKANDILSAFRPYLKDATSFKQATALIAATHALSFYSLKLQHGVPFQPVSIRVSSDPIVLLDKVLEQNEGSYAKLDDLMEIGRNIVTAGLPPSEDEGSVSEVSKEELARRKTEVERRVTFMAVEAALREDDFETAYSYVVNRLTPSGAALTAPSQAEAAKAQSRTASGRAKTRNEAEDDISWRAAFLAGRFRPTTSSTPPTLRRLEQRTELLSLALLLAPTSQLTDILAAWRRCEEEMTALQTSQQQAEEEFDDHADKRSALPGNFTISGDQPEMILNQKRREIGRMTGGGSANVPKGDGEAPMSMFDLTRSAASAFSRNAFPLRAQRTPTDMGGMESSVDSLGSNGSGEHQERVRKRDMVANAVSGGLASGLGWVLGATPGQPER
ncbi:hypothetical protein LTR97_000501 [Elasticomyces elasticus]|uniref:Sec39 domain-containing protein n=1 Tax=Elasticomyces elasticus TaxID=574655 RepID=A0AAN7VXH1_9PEZI|nr:hypothetical protein LTR97_000501 [Elasticomyces elasticus]